MSARRSTSKRWEDKVAGVRPAAAGPRRAEPQRPLPETWRPRGTTEEALARGGFKIDVVLALYRKAMAGRVRKRWTDQTFVSWFEMVNRSDAWPKEARKEAR